MQITLDQARALDALEREGTFTKAARSLGKQHSALVYAIQNLETQTGLTLLDRSGYRTRLSAAGERVLEACRRMLAAEREVEAACHAIRTGWEPRLRIVFDGVFPAAVVLRQVAKVAAPRTTRVEVFAEFLSGVEDAFVRMDADLMVSVLPPKETRLQARALAPIPSYLVAQKTHPLAGAKRLTPESIAAHALLTVRGSDPRLLLSTAGLEQASTIVLNDFHTKKEAILAGMGFGWLPEYLIEKELRTGAVVKLPWSRGNTHLFRPHVYHRSDRPLGRAAEAVVAGMVGEGAR